MRGAAKAIDFYADVFGATERMRFPGPDGTVPHAEVQIGDSVIIIEDESPVPRHDRATGWRPARHAGVPVHLRRGRGRGRGPRGAAGSDAAAPPEDQFYGDRDAYLVDPFGHGWTVATHIEDVSPDELGWAPAGLVPRGVRRWQVDALRFAPRSGARKGRG